MQQQNMSEAYFEADGGNSKMFQEIMAWNIDDEYHVFNPVHFQTNPIRDLQEPLYLHLPPDHHQAVASQLYGGGMFNRRSYNYERLLLSETVVGSSFGVEAELTPQEIMNAKALAASKTHSEAERRRRHRINNHLAKLRSLLPSTTKTDKASLLAEVIQHVKELKRQTCIIAESSPVPTETDELIVDNHEADEDGRFVIKVSICCQDRNDLFPDLINTLKALRLTTLKAEITTLGGRVKNVLFITGDDQEWSGDTHIHDYCITSIQEALKAVMERSNTSDESSPGSVKRQRTNINIIH